MSGSDKIPDHVASGVVRIPVGELVRRHVEIHAIAHLQPNTIAHRCRSCGIQVSHALVIDMTIRCFIQIAAYSQHCSIGIRKPPQHSNLLTRRILIAHGECGIVPAVLLVCPSTCMFRLNSVRIVVLCKILLFIIRVYIIIFIFCVTIISMNNWVFWIGIVIAV